MEGPQAVRSRLGPITPIADWRLRLLSDIKFGDLTEGRAVLEAEEVKHLCEVNNTDTDTILQALVPYAAKMALPYLSGFYVGAVGLGGSGRVYMGCNMEFPGSTLASSIHAEQCLIANLERHEEGTLVAVAISAPPCGHCRQFFSEMRCAYTVRLIFGEPPGNKYRLADILPHRFGPHDLLADSNQPLLLERQTHDLSLTSGARAILDRRKNEEDFQAAASEALTAAKRAYSPYRQTPAGIALVTKRGIHSGAIIENAAYNPTLQPLQAAFTTARFAGVADYSEVTQAVLVELENVPLCQAPTVEILLQAVSPTASLTVLFAEQTSR